MDVTNPEWNESLAHARATASGITLSESHWAVIRALQTHYHRHHKHPTLHQLIKALRMALNDTSVSSQTLYELFPEHPLKHASYIAGLPKPPHCV